MFFCIDAHGLFIKVDVSIEFFWWFKLSLLCSIVDAPCWLTPICQFSRYYVKIMWLQYCQTWREIQIYFYYWQANSPWLLESGGNLIYLRAWVLPAIILMSCVMIWPYCMAFKVHFGSSTLTSGNKIKLTALAGGRGCPLFATGGRLIPEKNHQ